MTVTAAASAKKAKPHKDDIQKVPYKPTHPPTLEMIIKAIEDEQDPKGTSVMAIKKHIMAHNRIQSAPLLNHMLRRAFESALAAGKLSRPKGQADTSLLAGRYRLASAKDKKAKAAAANPKKVAKSPAKKVAKSPAKKAAAKKPKAAKSPKKTPVKKAAKPAKKPAAKKSPKKSPKKAAPKKTTKRTAKK